MKKVILFLLIARCFDGYTQFKELHFNHLTNKNGLPSKQINSMLQDADGYIWMATVNGPVRFDGYDTKLYSLGDTGEHNNLYINQIFEDAWHRLWACSRGGGLFFYDNSRDVFVQYAAHFKKSPLLSADNVEGIAADRVGNLWVTTSNRTATFLDYINTQKHTALHFGGTQSKNNAIRGSINTVFADHEGNAWVGTDSGVYILRQGANSFQPIAGQQTAEGCRFFFEEPTQPGVIWMATGDYIRHPDAGHAFIGMARYNSNNGRWQYFKHNNGDAKSIASDTVGAINADKNGNIWLATAKGISLYNTVSQAFSNYAPAGVKKLSNDGYYGQYGPRSLVLTQDNNFWYSIDFTLYYFNTASKIFKRYESHQNKPDDLPDADPRQIMVDKDNNLWVNIGGIHWINRRGSLITRYQQGDTILHKFPLGRVDNFAGAANGHVWMYGPTGICQWRPETDSFSKETALAGLLKGSYVVTMMAAAKGTLWIIILTPRPPSFLLSLVSYDTVRHTLGRFKHNSNDSNSLPDARINVLFGDREGIIWMGTVENGIYSYNALTNKTTRHPFAGAGYNPVFAMHEDRQGRIWVVAKDGLYYLSRNADHPMRFETNFHDFEDVTAICEDSLGGFWIGTASSGVFVIDRNMQLVSHLTTKNGLVSDEINDIAEDSMHRYWLLSPPGFSIINANATAPAKLTIKNGFPDLSSLIRPHIFKTAKGLFLVSCDDGFIAFDPLDIKTDTVAPTVHIGEVRFSSPVARQTTDSIMLRWGKTAVQVGYNQNRITFAYIGLQYQYSELNTYACRLDGFDKDWQFTGTQRFITYNNLAPGTYVFHVKAANSDGFWGKNEDSIAVIIMPPWWQKWWAYALYVLVAGAFVWGFSYYRSKRLLHDNRLLEDSVKLRTAEVLEQKEEIAAQRDNLEKTLQELQSTQKQLIQSEKMASLGELTAGIAHEIQNPLNFVNNFSEVNKDLLAEMKGELENGNIDEAKAIANDVINNEDKINHHGRRADAIVKGMLQHSRAGTGQKELTDINALADEYLRLSYHGLRAKDKSFNAEMHTSFDQSAGKIKLVPQDMGRVLLNLFNNAFYAVAEKAKTATMGYKPTVSVSTKKQGGKIVLTIADNGNGIPEKIKDKIFQPFFTTKPTGQGTGLGLSLSYEIIKAHRGEVSVETKQGEGTEFIIELPYAQ